MEAICLCDYRLLLRTGLQQRLVLRFAKLIFYGAVPAEEVEADVSEHKFVVSGISRQIPFDAGEPLITVPPSRFHNSPSAASGDGGKVRHRFDYATYFGARFFMCKECSLHKISSWWPAPVVTYHDE